MTEVKTLNKEELISRFFPHKNFFPGQKNSIDNIINAFENGTDIFILESPTGTGKSAIAFTISRVIIELLKRKDLDVGENHTEGPVILILTGTKALQAQYSQQFQDIACIWSSQDYPCDCTKFKDENNEIHYGDPLCNEDKCDARCQYLRARNKFNHAFIGVTNYHYYINNLRLKPKILICDEAHLIESTLDNIDSIDIRESHLDYLKGQLRRAFINPCNSASFGLAIENFRNFIKDKTPEDLDIPVIDYLLEEFLPNVKEQHDNLIIQIGKEKEVLESYRNKKTIDDDAIISLEKRIISLSKALKSFSRFVIDLERLKIYRINDFAKSVVATNNHDPINFSVKPIYFGEGFDRFPSLNRTSIFTLLMSATICGVKSFVNTLGMRQKKISFLSVDSPIPVKQRPFYFQPRYYFTHKTKDKALPLALKAVDEVIGKVVSNGELIKSGIVHTVSHWNTEYILKNSKFKHLLFKPSGQEMRAIKQIMEKQKQVILSPSMTEGIDLPYDLSRWQIFIKVPYINLGDRWSRLKKESNNGWYIRKAVINIVQGTGRSIRSTDDFAITFMFDACFESIDWNLFPLWFRKSIKKLKN